MWYYDHMIIHVLELCDGGDLPVSVFLDIDKFDMSEPSHVAYRDKLLAAARLSGREVVTTYDCSDSYGDFILPSEAYVKPPCTVDASVCLFIEE